MQRARKIILTILFISLLAFVAYYFLVLRFERITYHTSYSSRGFREACNVGAVEVRGEILTYLTDSQIGEDYASSEDVYFALKDHNENEDIKVILVEVDSYGGLPVAAEEIASKMKKIEKPVIVLIREFGLSAGYWVASAGDKIFASKLSDIGSIAVTMSYLDSSGLNEMQGYIWNDLSTGKFKDSGTRSKPLTEEERALFERDLKIVHEEFIRAVALNRNMTMEDVRALADGSSMLGEMAKEAGLIDEIGSFYEVDKYIENLLGEKPEYCWG